MKYRLITLTFMLAVAAFIAGAADNGYAACSGPTAQEGALNYDRGAGSWKRCSRGGAWVETFVNGGADGAAGADGSGGSGMAAPPVCTGSNKALQWDGSSWTCTTIASGGSGAGGDSGGGAGGGGGVNLYQETHTDADCDAAGGSLASIEGEFVCGFNRNYCPVGWSEFKGTDNSGQSYTITSSRRCNDTQCSGSCNTGEHTSWDDRIETCEYSNYFSYRTNGNLRGRCVPSECNAKIDFVACY